jgi:isopenicillin N synthase-like dioxygenase
LKSIYRYFPTQPSATNLKEGFELGPPHNTQASASGPSTLNRSSKFNLSEPNGFPSSTPGFKNRCEALHSELQSLSAKLLSLVAIALGKPASFFDHYLTDSLSTLRLLHYPPSLKEGEIEGKVVCEPHTDSGILTLLHQDETGGLEVRNGQGEWVPAPYVKGSVVVNIGDLMERVSGGRWVATMHRVRESGRGERKGRSGEKKGRYSVPFFFEPGEKCLVRGVESGEAIVYGEHVLAKMSGWLEFQDLEEAEGGMKVGEGNMVAVY